MALNLFKEFATNKEDEQNGVWEPFAEGVEFLIARSGNRDYRKMLSKLYDQNKRLLDTKGPAAEAKSEEIIVKVMAKTILKGWKGEFEWQFDGQLQLAGEYTSEKAEEMLKTADFREWVAAKAADQARFKAIKDEDDLEN